MYNAHAQTTKASRPRRRSRTAIAAVTLAAGLTFGFGAPAMAQSPGLPSPSLNSPGLNSPGLTLPGSSAPKVKLGTVGGPIWSADVYSQIIRGKEVRPGDEVTIRIEVVGVNGEGKLRGIGHNIPADFELVRVTRQSQDNILGGGIYTLKEGGTSTSSATVIVRCACLGRRAASSVSSRTTRLSAVRSLSPLTSRTGLQAMKVSSTTAATPTWARLLTRPRTGSLAAKR
ncbi:MAG: hypothetical protein QP890_05435 [Corynebacterium amycolatum]|nr:hypothetical protein [Corynebacterium amycolatum]MDK8506864.1 hypothetical protein [Corynebacterium amycolatum]